MTGCQAQVAATPLEQIVGVSCGLTQPSRGTLGRLNISVTLPTDLKSYEFNFTSSSLAAGQRSHSVLAILSKRTRTVLKIVTTLKVFFFFLCFFFTRAHST